MAGHSAQLALSAVVKRLIDVVVSGALLVVALPVIAVVAAAVRLDTGGPVFFRCRRVGFQGTELQMLKFRKMRNGASGAALTVSGDERFTPRWTGPREGKGRRAAAALERAEGRDDARWATARGPGLRRTSPCGLRHDPEGEAGHHRPLPACLRERGRRPRPARTAFATTSSAFFRKRRNSISCMSAGARC